MATQATTRRAAAAAEQPTLVRRPTSWYVLQVIRYAFLLLSTVILLGPLFLAFFGSFKTNAEVLAWPPTLLPAHWSLGNYVDVWNNVKQNQAPLLPRWLFNSAFLAAVHVV